MQDKFKEFLLKKDVVISGRRYAIDALSAMAQGLFASLLIGTILSTIGKQAGVEILTQIANFAIASKGAAMAVAIGYALNAPALVMFSLCAVGYASDTLGGAGGPLAVYVVALAACEVGKIVSIKNSINIILTPVVTVVFGCVLAMWIAPFIGAVAMSVGKAVMVSTELYPVLMGAIVAAVIGMALTLPISSAAICAGFGLTGLAGGAALAGCCAQMVGFAVMSYKANGFGGFIAQSIGTSMLQMGNIAKKPIIWIPIIIVSAINGAIAAILGFQMNGAAIASGMGTCAFVGQMGVYTGWLADVANGTKVGISGFDWAVLLGISFIIPAFLAVAFGGIFKRYGLFNDEDLSLSRQKS
ncbi:PTS sugar transporter subunit IIC [Campylobacter sp. RM9344]|uniref:PTS sugar transporter subunit IIC n=1 Tax=Campylobacter californiensis TaxID=1032243 RepID=A0AAW3ZWV2_9BACT|nr:MULTISPECIES: PTS sugar transporter subunit IIC [unclassified Campylobacter]MBE2984506.1 PTS sugar transporter subunit IIC [Campylobacter sp. RM6883]MBE2985846.1 PTS sugar transporter subunit IIC [Campylobacter sp. RM12919]MBE2987961.1 PTS sugar transporter subunit IIC [Campylobacter sp. RM12920]MBE2994964.1 PTS sugar transporter subunit IIC [Campylobacter sp. RM6913]MBE3028947.1 PTS sugar transporter subunit IIC [Campylobacter sp. RM9344]